MALERSQSGSHSGCCRDVQSGTWLAEPICCRAQTVVQCQCQFCTWSPGHLGEPALVLQNFTLWIVSKVFCVDGFPRAVLHLRVASHTLKSVFQELPLWGGLKPSLSLVTSLSVRKPGIQVFLMIWGLNFVFIAPDKIQLSDGSSIMLF